MGTGRELWFSEPALLVTIDQSISRKPPVRESKGKQAEPHKQKMDFLFRSLLSSEALVDQNSIPSFMAKLHSLSVEGSMGERGQVTLGFAAILGV